MIAVYILLSILIILVAMLCMLSLRPKSELSRSDFKEMLNDQTELHKEIISAHTKPLENNISKIETTLSSELKSNRESVTQNMKLVIDNNTQIAEQNSTAIKFLKETVTTELKESRDHTDKQLDNIRKTVDEQLQTNLETKLQESFRTVSEQLIAVQRGLGEMQQLTNDVGDLRKTLSSVKTRGIWGEIQLGNILSEILTPEQYDINVATIPNSANRVEFAIKLPGNGDEVVYLPIDSKFPGDTYNKLLDAYESGQAIEVESAWKSLESTLMSEAKDISTKYVAAPYTTDFGIMFLPVEGLYAEAVKHGMVEKLQQKYRINIAGPTTMAALLNSLQMGFKTLQIQKQSSEVWKILQNAKIEFGKYADVLAKVQDNLRRTEEDLETLVGVRTRQMNAKLSKIDQYTPEALLGE